MATEIAGVLDALKATLEATGHPPGTLAAVYARTADVPYTGPLPALFLRGLQTRRMRTAARAKMLDGIVEALYIDATPEQEQRSLSAIEDEMYANGAAIGAAIDADPHLGGAVTSAGEEIDTDYTPDGPYREAFGGLFVSMTLHISFRGAKIIV